MDLRADLRVMLEDFGVDVTHEGEVYPKAGMFSTQPAEADLEGIIVQGRTAVLLIEEGSIPELEPQDVIEIGRRRYRVLRVDPQDDGLIEMLSLGDIR